MNKSALLAGACVSFAIAGAGCGSGVEPLSGIAQSNQTPQLGSLPLADAVLSTLLPFSESGLIAANDGFGLTASAGGQSVLAPAAGVVSYVDLTPGAAIVYIIHNTHLMTRMSALQSASVQVGQIVQQGSGIGLSPSSPAVAIHFSVFFDNAIVCPLTYLSFAEQKTIASRFGGLSACQ
jgi:hypothetical protein